MDEDKKLQVIIREELQKLSGMTWGQRLGYIWDYYKPLMVALICIIAAINVGVTIYHNLQQIDVIQVYMVNANSLDVDTEEMAAEFGEYIGGLKRNEVVTIDTSLTESGDEVVSEYTIAAQVKLMALTSSGVIDILILPEDVYEAYLEDGILGSMDDLLTEDQKEQWSDRLIQNDGQIYALDVEDSEVLQRYNAFSDGKIYAAVSVNASHTDVCGDFLNYLMG